MTAKPWSLNLRLLTRQATWHSLVKRGSTWLDHVRWERARMLLAGLALVGVLVQASPAKIWMLLALM